MGRAYQNRKESMAKTSDQKARVYSKHARVIYVTAKQGGVDPDGNLALRSAIGNICRSCASWLLGRFSSLATSDIDL